MTVGKITAGGFNLPQPRFDLRVTGDSTLWAALPRSEQTDHPPTSGPDVLLQLNQTPTGAAMAHLLLTERVLSPLELRHRLAIAAVLEWATANLAGDPAWAAAVDQAAVLAETNDPEALAENLDAPGLATAPDLRTAGRLLLAWVADLIPPGTQPA